MSDWITQFTSSYMSSIAYGITLVVFAFFLQRVYTPTVNWVKNFYFRRLSKQKSQIILPTKREQRRYSRQVAQTEKEWRDAIEFLKYDLDKFMPFSASENSLTIKFLNALQKFLHVFQYLSIGLGILNLILIFSRKITNFSFGLVILGVLFITVILSVVIVVVLLFVDRTIEKTKLRNVKSKIKEAMNVLTPMIAITYDELGDFLKSINAQELDALQSQLHEIGLPFKSNDLKLAYFLKTSSPEKIHSYGKKVVLRIAQFEDLSPEQKDEFADVLIEAIRLWPIELSS